MPDINSPLGRRNFASTAPRVLNVPNMEEASQQEIESAQVDFQKVQADRQERVNASRRITSFAKERIEILTGLGRLTEDIEFEGHVFSLQSLKAGEMKEVVRASANVESTIDSYFMSRNQILARALYAIDGQPMGLVLGNDSVESVLSWIDDMDDNLIEFLHNRYLEMVKKNKHRFEVKTEQELKEVVEDIKK